MKFRPTLIALAGAALLSGCQSNLTDDTVASMSTCDKVSALISQHSSGFEQIRKNPRPGNRMTVWDVRYDMVGKNCQVWDWGNNQSSYMCNLSFPDQESAMEVYNKGKQTAATCLGDGWQLTEEPRKLANGVRAVYHKAGSNTALAIHAIETKGVFKEEWSVYYFVGNPNDSL
ncbi:hypothetical protein [Pseudomaricurvus sp. HS19]|uniref:hypothetical protein n=1 Tax=Pseudomaricurvus sp. HS19 TaxID=2692626 RepID=UPI00136BE0CC|nr:hypothetical protein [Pseudomaricurvus sp. HS19]MYM62748.1 hypothetical protein [Pseudomaricurvus sp. HS19]